MDKKTAKLHGTWLVSGGGTVFGCAIALPIMMYILGFSDLWLMIFAFILTFTITGTILLSLGARLLKKHQIPFWKKENNI
jgi:predicted membrane protein